MSSDALFQIRATRSNPPGRAGQIDRRKTYGAALAQFDELMTAARAVGPAARPLPLFYALSQAGRAIAAAHCLKRWRLQGHGLKTGELSGPVLDMTVRLDDRKDRPYGETADSFRGVAGATTSDIPARAVSLRELWSSLPDAFPLLHEPTEAVPLALVPTSPDPKLHDWDRAQAAVVGFARPPDQLEDHLRAHFPSAEGLDVQGPTVPGVASILTPHGFGVPISWPAAERNLWHHTDVLNGVAPGLGLDPRWLRPGVAGVELSPLMTWWMLLYGLSMLARYQPDSWVDALQYDESKVSQGWRSF